MILSRRRPTTFNHFRTMLAGAREGGPERSEGPRGGLVLVAQSRALPLIRRSAAPSPPLSRGRRTLAVSMSRAPRPAERGEGVSEAKGRVLAGEKDSRQ